MFRKGGQPVGIIRLDHRLSVADQPQAIIHALRAHRSALEEGAIVTIEAGRIRVAKWPDML